MKRNYPPVFWAVVALAVVLLFDAFYAPEMFKLAIKEGRLTGSLVDVVHHAAPTMILALGMTLVIATFGVDLSVGSVMAIAGAVGSCVMTRPSDSPLTKLGLPSTVASGFTMALAAATVAGLFNGALVGFFEIQPVVATLVLMVSGRGIAQLLTNGQTVEFADPFVKNLGTGHTLGVPNSYFLVAVMFIATAILVRKTALGMFIEAVGSNDRASRLMGIDSRTIRLFAYGFTGFCAGVAGLLAAADIQNVDAGTMGQYRELDAILAVSIGGTSMAGGRFSLLGSIVGALLVQTLTTTALTKEISPMATLVIKAVVVVVVCLLQSPQMRAMVFKQRAA